ncbi:12446_t:CDS:2, partial [Acaulospora morrowiae]
VGDLVTADEVLKTKPELVELYEKLNVSIDNVPGEFQSIKMPNAYRSMIEDCLEENHYNAVFDLIESFQNSTYHPSEEQIRRLMDMIVNDEVENLDTATRAYRVLQHVLQTSGTEAFQNVWKLDEKEEYNKGSFWSQYTDFWRFIEIQFKPHQDNDKEDRTIMLLDHIVNVFETDIRLKKGNLGSTMLLHLIPKSTGKLRHPIQTLMSPFNEEEIYTEIARISQRLLEQIVLLSFSGYICLDVLLTEVYLQINKHNPGQFQLFLQTIISNVFRFKILDRAFQDTSLIRISHQDRNYILTPINMTKIITIYFYSTPYYKNTTRSIATWRHIFMLYTLFQSYMNSKVLRIGDKVHCGLDEEEVNLIINGLVDERVEEIENSLEEENIDSDIKNRAEFFLKMLKIDIKRIKKLIN